jgi:uncharacterized phage protein gp47/JayE
MADPVDGAIKAQIVVDRETIRDEILSEAVTEIEGASTSALSDIGIKAHVVAAPIEELRLAIYFALLQAFTPFATEEALVWKGQMYNLPRKEATQSERNMIFGKPQAEAYDRPIPAYQQMIFGDLLFQTTEAAVIAAGATTSDPVPAESVGEGTDYNILPGSVGTIIDPPVGIVTVTSDAVIQDAEDEEPLEDYRARISEWEQENVRGGDDNDYAVWAKEVDGVRDAKAYENHRGPGTIDIVVRSYDNGGVPTQDILDAVFAYIVGVPVAGTDPVQYTGGKRCMCADVQIWPAVLHELNVDAQVTPKDGYVLADITPDIEAKVGAYSDGLTFTGVEKLEDIRDILHDHPKIDNFVLNTPAADYSLQFAEISAVGTVSLS